MFRSKALKSAIQQLNREHPEVKFGGIKETNIQLRERNQAKLESQKIDVIINYTIETQNGDSLEACFFAIYSVDQNENKADEIAFALDSYEQAEQLLKKQ